MLEKTNVAPDRAVNITEAAVEETKRLLGQEKMDNPYLRLSVAAGGCSGMSYAMAVETEKTEYDNEYDYNGLKVLIDSRALQYLSGAILDYKGGMLGGGFSFENPNASRSCGCGTSFSC